MAPALHARRRFVIVGLLTAAALASAGCSRGPDETHEKSAAPEAPAPDASRPRDPMAGTDPAPIAPDPVTLLEAGRPPLRLLRKRISPGTRQSLQVAARTSPIRSGPEGNVREPAPVLRVKVAVAVEDASPGSDIRYRWTLERVEVADTEGMAPPAVDAMRRGVDRLPGSAGTGSLDGRSLGPPSEFQRAAGAGTSAGQAAQRFSAMLDQLLVPLPAEAVGVGARWQARRRVDEDGFQVDVLSTYELRDVSDDEVTLHAVVRREALRQVVKEPGGLPDTEVELLQLMSEGQADIVVDLSLPWPARASSFLVSTQAFRTTLRGQASHVMQAAETKVELVGR